MIRIDEEQNGSWFTTTIWLRFDLEGLDLTEKLRIHADTLRSTLYPTAMDLTEARLACSLADDIERSCFMIDEERVKTVGHELSYNSSTLRLLKTVGLDIPAGSLID